MTTQKLATKPTRTLPRGLTSVAWISFILNVLIIGTGGAVRLTGSGLGCSEWPLCTPDSLTPTPETGIHGIIEFANRTISGPLLIAALLVIILLWRQRHTRNDLFRIALAVLFLVIVQALIGAFVVWEELAAALVGFHYTVSVAIVGIAAAFLVRMYEPAGPRALAVPRALVPWAWIMSAGMAIVIVMGVITTASGPHSGDENVIRDGFDATIMSHLHAWPGYITLVLLLTLSVYTSMRNLRAKRWMLATTIIFIAQVLIGVYQARNGLPAFAVGVHMVLASLAAASTTVTMMRLRRPVQA